MTATTAPIELSEQAEMVLARVWVLREGQANLRQRVVESLAGVAPDPAALVARLEQAGLLRPLGEQLEFTPAGEARAALLVRRRRLTEFLFFHILNVTIDAASANACRVEHIIDEDLTDHICAFLGHPAQCPHGRTIPPGECCARRTTARPMVVPLAELPVLARSRIVFMSIGDNALTHRLTGLGIHPGADLLLRQKSPTIVLRVGETDVALEPALGERIFCRAVGENGARPAAGATAAPSGRRHRWRGGRAAAD